MRRFLGVDLDLGKRLGLSADWTQRIIKQVGNYGELFERHLGQKSPLKLERRLNNLSSQRRPALRAVVPVDAALPQTVRASPPRLHASAPACTVNSRR